MVNYYYYFITIKLNTRDRYSGVRQHETQWIDEAWDIFYSLAKAHFGEQVAFFDVEMISRYSRRFQNWDEPKKKEPPQKSYSVNGKYRRGAPKGDDKGWGKLS